MSRIVSGVDCVYEDLTLKRVVVVSRVEDDGTLTVTHEIHSEIKP